MGTMHFLLSIDHTPLTWVLLVAWPLLVSFTLLLLFDKQAKRTAPTYTLPRRGRAYFLGLLVSALALTGSAVILGLNNALRV